MRFAIFSDIHGNLPAWEAVLADMKKSSVDVAICLGDVVGYGPRPQEVLDGIRRVTQNFVLGNHDAAAVGLLDASIFNDNARTVVEWTGLNLNADAHEFLRNVPLSMLNGDLLFVHAEAVEPGAFGYIEGVAEARHNFQGSNARVIFVGHTHHPTLFVLSAEGNIQLLTDSDQTLQPGNRYIVNVGSAGEPRNPEDISARYVIFDDASNEVFFRRIAFDVEAYRLDLQKSGLSIRPFFLDVIDKRNLDKSRDQRLVMLADMESPLQVSALQAAPQELVIPSGGDDAITFGETRYQITGQLGEGGLGAVYRARDNLMDRDVALKKLHSMEGGDLSEEARESLRSEARVLGAFQHPNIVTVYAFEETPEGSHVVMELVDGLPLHEVVAVSPLNGKYFCDITEQILRPLIAANEINLIHRDIKPENIMLIPDGDQYRVKLLDFGLAKFSAAPSTQTVDQEGTFLGSLNFLAPEQLELGVLDARTDLYSLGCVLYYALTELAPFHGDSPAAISMNHLEHNVVPIQEHRPDLPPELANWVMRLINRNPDDRPFNAQNALEEFRVAAKKILEVEPNIEVESEVLAAAGKEKKFNWLVPFLLFLTVSGAGYFYYYKNNQAKASQANLLSGDNSDSVIIEKTKQAPAIAPQEEPELTAKPIVVVETVKVAPPVDVTPEPPVTATVPSPEKPAPMADPAIPALESLVPKESNYLTGLRRELIFYAPFDEVVGAKMYFDESGYDRHLPASEKLTPQLEGKVGNSCRFLQGQSVSSTAPLPKKDSADITLSFWLRLNDLVPGGEGAGNFISIPGWFSLKIGHLQFILDMDRNNKTKTHILPHSKKFEHIFINSSEGKTRLFINNKFIFSFPEKVAFKDPYPMASIKIGSPKARYRLDELLIWNRALSGAERTALFNQGKAGKPALSGGTPISHWTFDEKPNSRILDDTVGENDLGTYLNWSSSLRVAPDPSPVTKEENKGAARIKLLAVQPDKASAFELTTEKGFNLRGWFKPISKRVTIASSLGEEEDAFGWKLEALRANNGTEFMALSYGTRENKIQALAEGLNIYDKKAHKFSARWQIPMNRTEDDIGELSLVIDGINVASTSVPLSMVKSGQPNPSFQLGDRQGEFVIDELTFFVNDGTAKGAPDADLGTGGMSGSDLLTQKVEDAAKYNLVYDVDLKNLGPTSNYTIDRSGEIKDRFDRIGYFIEIAKADGSLQWAWATMDPFTDDVTKIGIPYQGSDIMWQKALSNLQVLSNLDSLSGTKSTDGNIEFWPNNYGPGNGGIVAGAADDRWDFGDDPQGAVPGYGSMQIHHPSTKQTVFAINNWKQGPSADVGIGNSEGQTDDWTFSNNADFLKSARLRILVRIAEP